MSNISYMALKSNLLWFGKYIKNDHEISRILKYMFISYMNFFFTFRIILEYLFRDDIKS